MALAQVRGRLPARADRRLPRPEGHRRGDRVLLYVNIYLITIHNLMRDQHSNSYM